jgi:hypothetical protein
MSFIYGKAAVRLGNWSYLDTVAVGWRSGNDPWWEQGRFIERLDLLVLAGEDLFREIFPGDRAARREVHRHTCRHFVGANIRGAIGFGAPLGFRTSAARLCWRFYRAFPEFYLHIVPSLLIPRWVLSAIRRSRGGATHAAPSRSTIPQATQPS